MTNDPLDDDGPDPADREPSPEQERAWDRREDDLRGHVLADAHAAWMGEDMPPDRA